MISEISKAWNAPWCDRFLDRTISTNGKSWSKTFCQNSTFNHTKRFSFLLQSLMKMLRKSIDWKRCSTVDGRSRKCNQKNVKVLQNVNFKDFIHALTFFSVYIVSYNVLSSLKKQLPIIFLEHSIVSSLFWKVSPNSKRHFILSTCKK